MEHINSLVVRANELKEWAEKAQAATVQADLDEAKVAGLKIYQETLRQVNRAFHEFRGITDQKRADISSQNFKQVQSLTRQRTIAAAQGRINELAETKVDAIPAPTETATKKTAKKTAKRAKK